MKVSSCSFLCFLFFISWNIHAQTIDQRVDSLLALMTLEEKVGQMTQVERSALNSLEDLATYSIGSMLSGGGSAPSPNNFNSWADMYDGFQRKALESRLGIPLIYGIDAVHGHNNVPDAVIFPHNIGMGCTWNPDLIREASQVVAREVAATGIDWTFAPCIAVARDERWGRTYEGFGETAEIQEIMAQAVVEGFQGSDLSDEESIVACAKHFVGDGGTINGIDQGNTVLSEEDLRAIHMPGYIDAIEAGVGTVMASYSSWNGTKLHGHDYLLTEVLKNELGFEGFVISDWKGVDQIDEDYRTAIRRAINAGIDMVMVPDRYEVFMGHLINLVQNGEVSETRINDAVRRILRQKFALNLFDAPLTDRSLMPSAGSLAHREVARQVVRESVVVLDAKNDVLPLQKNDQTIVVAGQLANDLGAQCGGWTISWQGENGNITSGTSLLGAIEKKVESSQVIYRPAGDFDGEADVAVVVIGEKTPYAEGRGDRNSLLLDEEDLNLIKAFKDSGTPVIALAVSGRPLVFGEALPYTDAMIAVWYPGSEGDGVADILFGDHLPTGKLTHSWPQTMRQIPINVGDGQEALYAYKHGLEVFPSHEVSGTLLPYAGTSNFTGDQIILTLSDKVSEINAQGSDFELFINGDQVENAIRDIGLLEFDKSILVLHLNQAIREDDHIRLSLIGGSIMAGELGLPPFSDYFVYNATRSSFIKHILPGRIEAEQFFAMEGIMTEPCTDIGGGENVGYLDPGDYLRYSIEVQNSGPYEITARLAGFQDGQLLLLFNDTLSSSIDYTATGGWQNWDNFSTTLFLEDGSYILEARAQNEGFNINYFDFDLRSTNVDEYAASIHDLKAFPNPLGEELSLKWSSSNSEFIKISLISLDGRLAHPLYEGLSQAGPNSFNLDLNNTLLPGIYFVEFKTKNRRYFTKVVKQ